MRSTTVKNTNADNRERSQDVTREGDHHKSRSYVSGVSEQHVSGKKTRRAEMSDDQ